MKMFRKKCAKNRIIFFALSFCGVLAMLLYTQLTYDNNKLDYWTVQIPEDDDEDLQTKPKGYLVWNPSCKIQDLNPLSDDILQIYTRQAYESCTTKLPLTTLVQDFDNDLVQIEFHHDLLPNYLSRGQNYYECCFYEITRSGFNESADDEFSLSKCNYFEDTFELPSLIEFVLIECSGMWDEIKKRNVKVIYTNAYAIVRNKRNHSVSTTQEQEQNKPINVLLVGIDSISRLNLLRAMPMTAQYLYDTGWNELKGYTKIDDNTFPNLMAILTGVNDTLAFKDCNPRNVGDLEKCKFIWNDYKSRDFITGYAEDEVSINTFNYLKKGFTHPPTHHYFRPFALAAEKKLATKIKHYLTLCLGYQYYADFIMKYAASFAITYKNDTALGLFWMNTFSHNNINDPSFMDLKIKSFLEELKDREVLNSSIVIFFSDHGMRFGPVRQLFTGWFEERTPFIFIWLPDWFKQKYKTYTRNLKINKNRLVSPYDLHMTLKHILKMHDKDYVIEQAISCPSCQSIFEQIPWNRSCEDAGITEHWCVCTPYQLMNKHTGIVYEAVKFVLTSLNRELDEKGKTVNNEPACAILTFKEIITARKSENIANNLVDFLIIFIASPANAVLEATVRYSYVTKDFKILGSVSRISEYGNEGSCISINHLRKYCYCLRKFLGIF